MAAVQTLLFDMDGVFCDYDFAERLRLLEEITGIAAADIEARIFTSGFEDKADWGQFGPGPYVDEVARLLGVEMDAETWLTARARAMTPYPAMFELARALKQRYPLALLSNNGWLLRNNIGRILPDLPEIFEDRLYFSAELGHGKESPGCFAPLLSLLGWDAATTLFIDDSPIYVRAATEAGLQTHLFTTPDTLRAALGEHGLV